MLYRIITENKNYLQTLACARLWLDSFTVIEAQGCWEGQSEPSLIIEVSGITDGLRGKVLGLAQSIKFQNQQQTVLIQEIECHNKFI